MKSLSRLMADTYHAALSVCYATTDPTGHYFDVREGLSETLADKAFAWADGLMHKHYENRATGRCSLAAMTGFDVAEWERECAADLALFQAEIKRVGKPRRLTFAAMRARGYVGAWAGMTEAETEAANAARRAEIQAEIAARSTAD